MMDQIARFEEIMADMEEINKEALEIVAEVMGKNSRCYQAARVYWFAQINAAIDGNSMEPMSDTCNEMMENENF